MITHYTQVYFRLGDYYNEICYFVTNLGKFDLILGMPWLEQNDPKLSFRKRTLTFDLKFRKSRCLPCGKSFTVNSCSSPKAGSKLESFTQRFGDLSEDSSDRRHFYQHQTILNRTNLDDNMQIAIEFKKQSDIYVEELVITLTANIVGRILILQRGLVSVDKPQAKVRSLAKAYLTPVTAPIQPQGHILLCHHNLARGGN